MMPKYNPQLDDPDPPDLMTDEEIARASEGAKALLEELRKKETNDGAPGHPQPHEVPHSDGGGD